MNIRELRYEELRIALQRSVILWRERLYQHRYYGQTLAPWEETK